MLLMNKINQIAKKIERKKSHEKFLMCIVIFLTTAFFPNDVGLVALFVVVFPLGLYGADMVLEEREKFKIVERVKNV